MQKQEVKHPDKADPGFTTGAYSAGVIAGGFLFISGQGPIDFKTGQFVLNSIEEETALTLHNIKRICEAAGCSIDDIVKCTVHLSDINDFERYNTIYGSHFTGIRPARTPVKSVLGHGIKVEIDAIVKVPEKG